jgi:hypothetical protein
MTTDQEVQGVLLLSFLPGLASGLISAVWLPYYGAIGVGIGVFFAAFVFWGVVGGSRG